MQMLCAAALLGVTGAAMGEVGRVHPAAISAARSRRSASSSSSARSWPSPPTAGCCGAARRASSSRPTPTSTRGRRPARLGRSPGEAGRPGRELAAPGAIVSASVPGCSSLRGEPRARGGSRLLPETVGPYLRHKEAQERPFRSVPRARRPAPPRALSKARMPRATVAA
jgi:hypothetical protein